MRALKSGKALQAALGYMTIFIKQKCSITHQIMQMTEHLVILLYAYYKGSLNPIFNLTIPKHHEKQIFLNFNLRIIKQRTCGAGF